MNDVHVTRIWLKLSMALMLLGFFVTVQARPLPDGGVDDKLGTLVTAEWLNQHLDDPDLVVLDCRVKVEFTEDGSFKSVSGLQGYEAGHIPSAGFADLTTDLSDTTSPFQFTLPSAEQFAAAMGALGVGDNSRVVLYDDFNSAWAARVWWMLRWIGFDRVSILDGGLGAWTAAGYQLSTGSPERAVQKLSVEPRPELVADQAEVFAAITDENVHLIDAMPESHYRGEMVLYDWPGHIPTATNTPSTSLLDESGRYRPLDQLATMFGGKPSDRVITYCGGGISASSDAFILTRLGFTDVAVYMGSLQEWTADSDNPMEVD